MKKWNAAEIVELNISETALNTNWDDHMNWLDEYFNNTDKDGDGWIGYEGWGIKAPSSGNEDKVS